ncbi:hypothetical protein KKH23_07270 [Patescibacteria group bacterium]|nr:hypothetical protein [Patescibacteria group bacterium]
MNKQSEKYYEILREGKQPPIIGMAYVHGEWRDIEFIDESKANLMHRGVRVTWRDKENRRVTSFVCLDNIKKYQKPKIK